MEKYKKVAIVFNDEEEWEDPALEDDDDEDDEDEDELEVEEPKNEPTV